MSRLQVCVWCVCTHSLWVSGEGEGESTSRLRGLDGEPGGLSDLWEGLGDFVWDLNVHLSDPDQSTNTLLLNLRTLILRGEYKCWGDGLPFGGSEDPLEKAPVGAQCSVRSPFSSLDEMYAGQIRNEELSAYKSRNTKQTCFTTSSRFTH